MAAKQLNPEGVFDPKAFGMSQGVVDLGSGLVFVSGQVAWDVEGRVVGTTYGDQTRRALQNLIAVLGAAGATAADVLSVRLYLRGELTEHIRECNAVLAAYWGETRPALTAIGVASLSNPDTLVEIEVVARVAPPG